MEAFEAEWAKTTVEEALASAYYPRSLAEFRLFADLLPRNAPILEAGCGLANVVLFLRRLGYDVVGVDAACGALGKAHAYSPTLKLAGGDVRHLPFASGTFGAYLSFGVLEHFPEGPEQPLREAHRILEDDGFLLLTLPYPNLWVRLIVDREFIRPVRVVARAIRRARDPEAYERWVAAPRESFRLYRLHEMKRYVEAAGFECFAAHPISHSYLLHDLCRFFRADEHGRTTPLADRLGTVLSRVLPWHTAFMMMLLARKLPARG